jgi:hypothetical protein
MQMQKAVCDIISVTKVKYASEPESKENYNNVTMSIKHKSESNQSLTIKKKREEDDCLICTNYGHITTLALKY